jgi:hypothetical protein
MKWAHGCDLGDCDACTTLVRMRTGEHQLGTKLWAERVASGFILSI